VGQEKDDNVQRDESEGDVGPAAAAHVFVPQRNEQFVFSPKVKPGWADVRSVWFSIGLFERHLRAARYRCYQSVSLTRRYPAHEKMGSMESVFRQSPATAAV
jgi:hypothetical protein